MAIIDSKYEKIRNQCLATGKPWEDPDFPANDTSIGPKRPEKYPIMWKRPNEILRGLAQPEFIFDGGDRFDVLQGELGDCWLLAALASLTSFPKRFERVVPTDQSFQKEKYTGVFRFHFWKYGEWVEVLVDDRLPTFYNSLQYAQASPLHEYWAPLLEKAYAKFYGNYQTIVKGSCRDALTDFTGGLAQYFLTQNLSSKELMKMLTKAVERKSILSTGVNTWQMGLLKGHAYSITGVFKVKLEDGTERDLIRIRNPWGGKWEWNGRWSDSSDEWKMVSEKKQKELGYMAKDDGEFWIEIPDFLSYFHSLDICYVNAADMFTSPEKQRCWSISTFHGRWTKDKTAGGRKELKSSFAKNPQFIITLSDSDEDEDYMASFVVELTQMNRRRQNLEYLVIGFYIYQTSPDTKLPMNYECLSGCAFILGQTTFINSRAICKNFTMVPGKYVIIPTTWDVNEEADFMLRVFSETNHKSQAITG